MFLIFHSFIFTRYSFFFFGLIGAKSNASQRGRDWYFLILYSNLLVWSLCWFEHHFIISLSLPHFYYLNVLSPSTHSFLGSAIPFPIRLYLNKWKQSTNPSVPQKKFPFWKRKQFARRRSRLAHNLPNCNHVFRETCIVNTSQASNNSNGRFIGDTIISTFIVGGRKLAHKELYARQKPLRPLKGKQFWGS